jgi:isoleucyl-tRNA synthetase
LQLLQRFTVADLSNWYLDVIKDRLYVSAADSFDRRASQTVLHALLQVCDVFPALMLLLGTAYPECTLCTTSKLPADLVH